MNTTMTTDTMTTPLQAGGIQASRGWKQNADEYGIWDRFNVVDRIDDELVQDRTFVLLPDTDPHAKAAMMAYARSIQNDNPTVASQIWEYFPDTNH
jgi:hypothetical protein